MVVVADARMRWRRARVAGEGAHAHDWLLRVPARLAPGSRVLWAGPDRAFRARHPRFAGGLDLPRVIPGFG